MEITKTMIERAAAMAILSNGSYKGPQAAAAAIRSGQIDLGVDAEVAERTARAAEQMDWMKFTAVLDDMPEAQVTGPYYFPELMEAR